MSYPDEFSVKLFSKDSANKFDNTLSNFTVQLEQKLPLEPGIEYECGLTEILLNAAESSNFIEQDSRDYINFAVKETKTLTIKEFSEYVLNHAVFPHLYFDKQYFNKYLNREFFYDPISLRNHFNNDDVFLQGVELEPGNFVTIKFNFESLLKNGETIDSFMAVHRRAMGKSSFPIVTMKLPIKKALTMKQVLFKTIEVLIAQMRHGFAGISNHVEDFLNSADLNTWTMKDKVEHMREHLSKINEMVHRFITAFTDNIVEAKETHDIKQTTKSRLLMVYTDIIRPQIVSEISSRLLYLMTYEASKQSDFHLERVRNIQFSRVEPNEITKIMINLKNELGESINFIPTVHSTYVNLKFRKVK